MNTEEMAKVIKMMAEMSIKTCRFCDGTGHPKEYNRASSFWYNQDLSCHACTELRLYIHLKGG